MDDTPFSSGRRRAPGAADSTDVIWTKTSDGNRYRAELRMRESWGCELRIVVNDDVRIEHVHVNREFALLEATMRREILRLKGWNPA